MSLSGLKSRLSGLGGFRGGAGGGRWTPADLGADLFAGQTIAAVKAAGGLWQDTGKTTAATAAGDPVRVVTMSGVDFTAPSDAARMVLRDEGSGIWSLDSDGTDDGYTFTPTGMPTGGSGYGLAVGWRNDGSDLSSFRIMLAVGANTPAAGNSGAIGANVGTVYCGYHDTTASTAAGVVVNATWYTFCGNFSSADVVLNIDGTDRPAGTGASGQLAEAGRVGWYMSSGLYCPGRYRGWVIAKRRLTLAEQQLIGSYFARGGP